MNVAPTKFPELNAVLERVWELYGSIPPLLLLLIVCMMDYWYGVSK